MLVDPLFNHVFVDSQDRELSALQVKAQWRKSLAKVTGDYDILQLPAEYDAKYNYQQGFRYTSWDKLGFVSRAAYNFGKLIGLQMDTLSFRAIFIRQHSWNLAIYSLGLLITLFVGLRIRLKR